MDQFLDPDGALVAQIAAGDQFAVRELVSRHIGPLMSVSRRMLGNQDDAEEVVQEVFLKVWTHAAAWEPGKARFSTWMHRVAINGCYDRLRRRREVPSDQVPERRDEAPDPEDRAIASDLGTAVDGALQQLPARQRAALVLCHYQCLSQVEAAEMLDTSVEALESLLARGRRSLRDLLRDVAGDFGIGERRLQKGAPKETMEKSHD